MKIADLPSAYVTHCMHRDIFNFILLLIFMSLPSLSVAETDSLETYQWKNRLLVWHSPEPDRFLKRFESAWRDQTAAIEAREMKILQIAGNDLRRNLAMPVDKSVVLLIGKDGTVKARWHAVPEPNDVYRLIDQMPMRQREMLEQATD